MMLVVVRVLLLVSSVPAIEAAIGRAPPFEDQVKFDKEAAVAKYCRFYPGEELTDCAPRVRVGEGVDFFVERDKVFMDPCELDQCQNQPKFGCGWKGEEELACRLLRTNPNFDTDCNPDVLATLQTAKNFRKFRYFLHEETGVRILAFRFCPVDEGVQSDSSNSDPKASATFESNVGNYSSSSSPRGEAAAISSSEKPGAGSGEVGDSLATDSSLVDDFPSPDLSIGGGGVDLTAKITAGSPSTPASNLTLNFGGDDSSVEGEDGADEDVDEEDAEERSYADFAVHSFPFSDFWTATIVIGCVVAGIIIVICFLCSVCCLCKCCACLQEKKRKICCLYC